MPKIINYDDYIGSVYTNYYGEELTVLSVDRETISGRNRTVCSCVDQYGVNKKVRLDSLKNFKDKPLNKYEDVGDYIIGYLKNGETFKIDKEDYDRVKGLNWMSGTNGYLHNQTKNKSKLSLHRFIMGVTDSSVHVDHINHDVKDNRRCNLRLTDNQHNSMNKGYARSNTGYIGIHKNKRCLYEANIKYNYKKINLGTFKDIDDAIKARLKAEIEYFGEFAPQKHLFKEYGIGDGSIE